MLRTHALRVALFLFALLLLALSSAIERGRRRAIDETRAAWSESGLEIRHPGAAPGIERETDPAELRLLVARVILADSLQASWLGDLQPDQIPTAVQDLEARLVTAAEWAREGLADRPLDWEAPLVLGGARFLSTWRSSGDSLYADPERWLAPLELARELAPMEAEPLRLEAAARLAAWPGLSRSARQSTLPVLRKAFEDDQTLRILLPDWRAAAKDSKQFESILPDRRGTWSLLLETYARENRWEAFCRVRPLWWRSVLEEGHRMASDASRQLDLGDPHRARGTLLALVERIPIDRRTAPLVDRALDRLPAGPVRAGVRTRLEGWLEWALPLWSRDLPSLSPRTFGRIASLGGSALPPELEAGAWLASGDLHSAREAEARSERLWAEEWGAYFLAKAHLLARQGREDEAREALETVHETLRGLWSYGDLAHRLALREELPTAKGRWRGTEWRWRGADASMEVALVRPAAGLLVDIDEVASEPTGWILSVDGRESLCTPARESSAVALRQALAPGAHWLQASPAGGIRVVPGDLRLPS